MAVLRNKYYLKNFFLGKEVVLASSFSLVYDFGPYSTKLYFQILTPARVLLSVDIEADVESDQLSSCSCVNSSWEALNENNSRTLRNKK